MSQLQSGMAFKATVTLLLLTAMQIASAGAEFRLERLTPREMPLAPGNSTNYVLRIRNVGNEAGSAPLLGAFYWENRWDPYVLTQSNDPRCGPLHWVETSGGSNGPGFETAPIEPGEHLDCAMKISRPAVSPRDTSLTFLVRDTDPPHANHSGEALIGTLTDASLYTRTLDFSVDSAGIAHATVELSVRNAGHVTINEQHVGNCYASVPLRVLIDGSGPEGCGEAIFGPTCFDGGYGFHIPAVPAGSTYRCRMQLHSPTVYESPLQSTILLDLQSAVGGGTLMNISRDHQSASLYLGPIAAAAVTHAVPAIDRYGAPLLLFGLGFLGWLRVRSTPH